MQVQCGRGKRIKGLMLPISEPGVCFYNTGRRQRSRTGMTAVSLGVGRKVNGTRHIPISYAPQPIPVLQNRSFSIICDLRGHKLTCCTLSMPVCQSNSRPQQVPFICTREEWLLKWLWVAISFLQYFGGVCLLLIEAALFTFDLVGLNLYYPKVHHLHAKPVLQTDFLISFLFAEWYVDATGNKANKKEVVHQRNYVIQCAQNSLIFY